MSINHRVYLEPVKLVIWCCTYREVKEMQQQLKEAYSAFELLGGR